MSEPSSLRPRPIRPIPAPPPGVYTVGRGTLVAAAAVATLVSTWAGGATWYLLAKDDLAARFLRQQGEMQVAYEWVTLRAGDGGG